jgi:glycosyltransferase involved in cell wall biosynthesis
MGTPYKKVSVLVAAYNEEATIAEIVRRIKALVLSGLEKEILVVDDGSGDRTHDILRGLQGIRVIFHETNKGKGGALKTALAHATGDVMILQDADLEYEPEDYAGVLAPILQGKADLVMGSRFKYEKPKFFAANGDPFITHYIGNLMITWLTNILYGQKNTDYEGCYKAFTRSVAQSVPIQTNRFAFDNELVCKSIRLGYRVLEVPIRYRSRMYSEGKKISWRDGVSVLWTILKWRILPVVGRNSAKDSKAPVF